MEVPRSSALSLTRISHVLAGVYKNPFLKLFLCGRSGYVIYGTSAHNGCGEPLRFPLALFRPTDGIPAQLLPHWSSIFERSSAALKTNQGIRKSEGLEF